MSRFFGFRPSTAYCVLALATLSLVATPSSAQGPPPVTADDIGIYASAVDPSEYPDDTSYVLLEEARVRLESDGTMVRSTRVVRQILRESAVRQAAELSFSYSPTWEEFSLDWARVVEPGGMVVQAEPVHVQESDVPIARTAPVYSDRRQVRASLGDVAVGRIVDLQYTIRLVEPPLPGDLWLTWSVNGAEPIGRSRMTVDAPSDFPLNVREWNLPHPGNVHDQDGRVVREWDYAEPTKFELEPWAAEPNDVAQRIRISGGLSWDDVARWYTDLAKGRYEVTPEMEKTLGEIVSAASSRTDSLKALHKWVSQDIRYASISLGLAGYQPRPAAEVMGTGVGDCKDKTTLFLALARRLGLEGAPVLVSTTARGDPDSPSVRPFDHMIAAVEVEGGWRYLDLTTPFSPFDEIYGPRQGRLGVLLAEDGTAEVLRFPESAPESNRSSILVDGVISEDGSFEGTYVEEVTGAIQYRIRGEFARPLTERSRASVKRNIANRVFDGARTDSLVVFDGLDLEVTPRLWGSVSADSVVRTVGDRLILPLKIPGYGSAELIARLEEMEARRFPIDVESVFGRREHFTSLRFQLPAGWKPELPEDVHAESLFGSYVSTYRMEGADLVVTRRMTGRDGVVGPEAQSELVEWFRTLHADRVEDIVISVSR